MKRLLLVVTCLAVAACSPTGDTSADDAAPLAEGTWTGGLAPMNHPEQMTPLTFDVGYDDETLTVVLGGPGGVAIPTRDVMHRGDSLHFVFDEPEEGVALHCGFAADGQDGYAGRCADADGKWAAVTMVPPTE
jgi:hypothetical protein